MADQKCTVLRVLRRHGNVIHVGIPNRPQNPTAPINQYRQDIWDSFPHLKRRAPLSIHPYHETQD